MKKIWQQEHDTNGFAINGELTPKHWEQEINLFFQLNPELQRVTAEEIIVNQFVENALVKMGTVPGPDSPS